LATLLANDVDVENDPISFVSFTQPAHGHVELVTEPYVFVPPASAHAGLTGEAIVYSAALSTGEALPAWADDRSRDRGDDGPAAVELPGPGQRDDHGQRRDGQRGQRPPAGRSRSATTTDWSTRPTRNTRAATASLTR
jgi:hypothetical protein